MASSAAVVYIKPRVSAYLTVNGQSAAVAYMAPRAVSGRWSSGVVASSDLTNLMAFLPKQNQSIGYVNSDGRVTIDGGFWRYLNQLATVIIGQNPTPLADIVAATVSAIEQSQALSGQVSAESQRAQQNAESLAAAVQVVQTAALAGSAQIPPPQTHVNIP